MAPPTGRPWLTPGLLAAAQKVLEASGGTAGRVTLARSLGISLHKAQIVATIIHAGDSSLPPPEPPVPDLAGIAARKADPFPVLRHLRSARTVEDLADLCNCTPREVRAQLQRLTEDGHPIRETGGCFWLETNPTPAETRVELPPASASVVRFGVVSDTHLGSARQQITYLRDDYRRMADAGITTVLHAGDMLAGVGVYRGQPSDLFVHTYDGQADYAIERYPREPGIRTILIGGNHDLAGLKSNGADPLRRIARERPDIEYLGPYSAWLLLGDLRIYLLHPEGGQAYAKSYKLQKLAESFTGGEKPHVAVVGHWHSRAYIDERNVHLFLAGCYEAQTDYERRHLLSPVIGGGIIEVEVNERDGWHAMTPTFFRHMVPKEKDR